MTLNPQIFRIEPKGRPELYKTYQVLTPVNTHTRVATCAEVECQHHLAGWITKVDVSTKLGKRQANYIRLHSGRTFTHEQSGTLVSFRFPAGQSCFREHRVSLEREPIFRIRGGDHRGNPLALPTRTLRPKEWLEDFGSHQEALADEHKKG